MWPFKKKKTFSKMLRSANIDAWTWMEEHEWTEDEKAHFLTKKEEFFKHQKVEVRDDG